MKHFSIITMPGGEQHVKYIGPPEVNPIVRVEGIVTADKIIAAGMACEIYYRIKPKHSPKVTLVLPYFPGARQDRVDIDEVGFSLQTYAKIISDFNFKDLVILDPHSIECEKQLKNYGVYPVTVINHEDWFLPWIEKTTFTPGPHKFLFPDKGALAKYGKVATYNPHKSCTKLRDPNTGKLSGFEVPDLQSWRDNFIWIVDDICDGGGTFIAIAEAVRKQLGNNCQLGLAVSHGIFSNKESTVRLMQLFDYIVTTDSVYTDAAYPKEYPPSETRSNGIFVQPLSEILTRLKIC